MSKTYIIPNTDIHIDPEDVRIIMISEAPPPNPADGFYAPGEPFFMQTTKQAFADAGTPVSSIHDILDLGIYITTVMKRPKASPGVPDSQIEKASHALEEELAAFPNVTAYLLMGDVAIKAFNHITRRNTGKSVIPSGPTYKVRRDRFFYQDRIVFPSYVPTGKSFLIEKSKRRMVAEDIRRAMDAAGVAVPVV